MTITLDDKMENTTVYPLEIKSPKHRKILLGFNQPLTTKQIIVKTGIPEDTCENIVAKLAKRDLITCLNSSAGKGRLYWLTELGKKYQMVLCWQSNISYKECILPDIDWQLYGWVCFNHRSAIIKILTAPMQPSKIKQILRIQKPNLKISANNIRDVIRLFLDKKIVRSVKIKNKGHLRYELTDLGQTLRQLLVNSSAQIGQGSSNHNYRGGDN